MGLLRKKRHTHKFCPVCGTQLRHDDTYCTRCGYSFASRHKRARKTINWRNIALVVILLLIAYGLVRYVSGLPPIPSSIDDALNLSSILP